MSTATRLPVPQGTRRAPRPSTFACKLTMAVTGALFAVFVLAHMVGNLKAYFGAEDFNAYAHWLRTAFHPVLPYEGLLWILRVVLLVALVAHVACATILWLRGRRHRGPHRRRGHGGWFGARSMMLTGVLLLVFIVFHLLDLSIGTAGASSFQPATRTESFAHQNLVASFQRPWSGGAYLAAMVALGVHLAHGIWTIATDLGVTGRRVRHWWRLIGYVIALLVVIGNASLPIAVWTGVLG